MWTLIVIVLGIFGEDLGQMSIVEDQHPVEHLTAERSDNPLADRVRAWSLWRGLMIRTPSARKTTSKAAMNLVSPSRAKNRSASIRGP
jgi:hypothetical protein